MAASVLEPRSAASRFFPVFGNVSRYVPHADDSKHDPISDTEDSAVEKHQPPRSSMRPGATTSERRGRDPIATGRAADTEIGTIAMNEVIAMKNSSVSGTETPKLHEEEVHRAVFKNQDDRNASIVRSDHGPIYLNAAMMSG